MPLRCGVVLWLSCAVACASSRSAPRDDAAIAVAPTDASADGARAMDAGAQDAARADAHVADTGIDPGAIYPIDVCPQEPAASTLPIDGMHPRPTGCTRSSDCTAHPHGICAGFVYPDHIAYPQCLYEECVTDAQCPADQRCACGFDGIRRCLRVDCDRDRDCAAGRRRGNRRG
jgi:hypothetical protein